LNGCPAKYNEITWPHNKVVNVVRRAIEEQMVNRPHSGIGENTTMQDEPRSEERGRLTPDLKFSANTHCTRFTVMIDISCPDRDISSRENMLEKVYIDKLEKSATPVPEVKAIRDMPAKIIPVILSSLGPVHEQLLKARGQLFMCEERDEKRIGGRPSEAAIGRSLEIWRGYAPKVMHSEDLQVREVYKQEARMAGDK
jgi:hypothetical protein